MKDIWTYKMFMKSFITSFHLVWVFPWNVKTQYNHFKQKGVELVLVKSPKFQVPLMFDLLILSQCSISIPH